MALEERRNLEARRRYDEAVERAARKAARTTALRAATGYFLLILILLVGSMFFQRSTNHRFDADGIRQCERVQLQRERTNVSDARQFIVFYAVSRNRRPSPTIRRTYRALEATAQYDPPTDCNAAIEHPGSYKRPESVPFDRLGTAYAWRIIRAARAHQPQPTP